MSLNEAHINEHFNNLYQSTEKTTNSVNILEHALMNRDWESALSSFNSLSQDIKRISDQSNMLNNYYMKPYVTDYPFALSDPSGNTPMIPVLDLLSATYTSDKIQMNKSVEEAGYTMIEGLEENENKDEYIDNLIKARKEWSKELLEIFKRK